MRRANWDDFPRWCVRPDSHDLNDLGIWWVNASGADVRLQSIWICSRGGNIHTKWRGIARDVFTSVSGTWITTNKESDDTQLSCGYLPLTQAMLCADNCAPLMEILYHDHEMLLTCLER